MLLVFSRFVYAFLCLLICLFLWQFLRQFLRWYVTLKIHVCLKASGPAAEFVQRHCAQKGGEGWKMFEDVGRTRKNKNVHVHATDLVFYLQVPSGACFDQLEDVYLPFFSLRNLETTVLRCSEDSEIPRFWN